MNIGMNAMLIKQRCCYKNEVMHFGELNAVNNQLSTIDTGTEPSTNNKSGSNKNVEMLFQSKNSKKLFVKYKHNENRRDGDIANMKIKGSSKESNSKIKLKKRNANVLNLDVINHNCVHNKRSEDAIGKNGQHDNQKVYTLENERGINMKHNYNIDNAFMNIEDADKIKGMHKQTEPTYLEKNNKMYFNNIYSNNKESNEIVSDTQNEMHKNFNMMKMRRKECLEKKQTVLKNTKKNVIALFYNSTNNNPNDTTSTQINFELSSSESNDEEDKLLFSQIHKNFEEQQQHQNPKHLQISKEICFDVCSLPVTSSTSTAIHLTSSNPPNNQQPSSIKPTSHSKTISHIPILKFKKINTNSTPSSHIMKPDYNMHTTTSNNNRYLYTNTLHKSMSLAIANIISSHSKPKSKSQTKSNSKHKKRHNKTASIHHHSSKASSSFSKSSSQHHKHSNLKVIIPPHKENASQIKLLLQLNSMTSLNNKSKSFRFFNPQHFHTKDNKNNTIVILNSLHYVRFDEKEETLKEIMKSNYSTFMIYISYEYNLFYYMGLYYVDNKNEMIIKLTTRNKYALPLKIKFRNINMCYLCKNNSLLNLIAKSLPIINENECIVFFKKNLNFN